MNQTVFCFLLLTSYIRSQNYIGRISVSTLESPVAVNDYAMQCYAMLCYSMLFYRLPLKSMGSKA